MKSLTKLYHFGPGPSSSHTIGPKIASEHFLSKIENLSCNKVVCTLYGSLALTGKGHGTLNIIKNTFPHIECEIKLDYLTQVEHPNKMVFSAYRDNNLVFEKIYYSVGGGTITSPHDDELNDKDIYPFKNFDEIKKYMVEKNYTYLHDVCRDFEEDGYIEYMYEIFDHMVSVVESGLVQTGQLQAGLKLWVDRNAKKIYDEAKKIKNPSEKTLAYLSAYAYAVSEENASGHNVVTAPTCGSCGVIPAVVYYLYKHCHFSKRKIVNGLISAGMIGNVFKQNATISGAVGGCQAEVGVAVCMATCLFCDVYNLGIYQVEYGCELAMEHHLGLTCDSVDGFVVIPCVERNAVGAVRSYESFLFAKIISKGRKNSVSLDEIVETMKMTGEALPREYRETGIGGISHVKKNK